MLVTFTLLACSYIADITLCFLYTYHLRALLFLLYACSPRLFLADILGSFFVSHLKTCEHNYSGDHQIFLIDLQKAFFAYLYNRMYTFCSTLFHCVVVLIFVDVNRDVARTLVWGIKYR